MVNIAFSLFILGLSFGIGPCVSSCGPLLISYTVAVRKNVFKNITAYLIFSLSRISVYILLSLLVFLFSRAVFRHAPGLFSKYLFLLGGLFIVILGLLIARGSKAWDNRICQKIHSLFLKNDTKTIIMLGLIIGVLPCAPFISVVSYIGLAAKNWLDSVSFALAFGIGTLISPVLILMMLAGFIPKAIKQEKFYRVLNFICGLIIAFLGLQLIRRFFYA